MSPNTAKLTTRIEELYSLLNEAEEIINMTEIDDMLHEVMAAGKKIMKVKASSLWLLDKDRGELYMHISLSDGKYTKERISMKLGKGIVGQVAQTGKPMIVENPEQDPLYDKRFNGLKGISPSGIACVPLITPVPGDFFSQAGKDREKEIIGVILAYDRVDRPFNKEDLENFAIFARIAASSIQKKVTYDRLKTIFFDSIIALAEAIDSRHSFIRGHSRKVSKISKYIQGLIHPDPKIVELVRIAALLHDVGMVSRDDHIVKKPEKLSPGEFEHIKKHSVDSFKILEPISNLKHILPGVLYHHERWDGKGYPSGLKGEEIPSMARIIAVADAFDAMTSDRPYRSRKSREATLMEMKECSGTQFDPDIIDTFISAYETGNLNKETAA